ncbi:MAG: PilX N-terminal domain-containing pilus assembly protein [bacterium]
MKVTAMQKREEEGSAIIVVLLILMLLLLLGTSAINMSLVELQIAKNDHFHKLALYAAESSVSFVKITPSLYGTHNITKGMGLNFPNNEDPSEEYSLITLGGPKESFHGEINYLGSSPPERGSGFDAEKFVAHHYSMNNTGYGPGAAKKSIEVGFYRVGY